MVARGALERDAAAGDRGRHHEGPGLDAVGDHAMLGAAQALAALDLDGVGRRPLDRGAHLLEERDEVVDLGLLGGGPDDRVPVGEGRREHRVLRAHDRHEGERDGRPAQPTRGRGEVVAVAVVDRGAQRPHRVDVQVDRPTADPVAARVADDDPAEPGEERAEQDEARPHLGRGLERHEEPLHVTRGDLVDVGRRMLDDDAEVAQRLRHHADVLDLGDVREPAALAGKRGRRHELQGRVLGAADRDRALERPAAVDTEELPGDRFGLVLPVERPCVSHVDLPRPSEGRRHADGPNIGRHYPRCRGPSR